MAARSIPRELSRTACENGCPLARQKASMTAYRSTSATPKLESSGGTRPRTRPIVLRPPQGQPKRKHAAGCSKCTGHFRCVSGDLEHPGDFNAKRRLRILGKPLRRQIIRREAVLNPAINFDAQAHHEVWRMCHRRDAVTKRHPQREIANEKPKFANREFHINANTFGIGWRRSSSGFQPLIVPKRGGKPRLFLVTSHTKMGRSGG